MRYLYFHGFASGPQSGKAQYLKQRFDEAGSHLEIPDLNLPDFESMTISAQLAAAEEAMASQSCCLLGSSMGGYLAALLASRNANVHRVVLLAPAFDFFQRWPLLLGEEVFAAWEREGSREVLHYGENRVRRIGWQMIEDARQYAGMPQFFQPALILHGVGDDTVPAELSQRYAEGRSNVTLHLLESDHQLTDQVEVIWQKTRTFLSL